ncbi:hypothetical protein ACFU8Q_17685 [Streptomyces sp. NPDC057543]
MDALMQAGVVTRPVGVGRADELLARIAAEQGRVSRTVSTASTDQVNG